ncbi:MAG: zinc-binding dehydrogenase, partial [Rhodobiaceae bacterium]|nr:zinc-binding dehydrogenase [Rhodobiaceae bacterium]
KNLAELMSMFQEGKLKPHISATYPLDRAADALTDMGARKVTGKIVLTVAR